MLNNFNFNFKGDKLSPTFKKDFTASKYIKNAILEAETISIFPE